MVPSSEVTDAVGQAGESLDEKRERLRAVVATKSEKEVATAELAQVERQIAEREAAGLQGAAVARLLGIVRAVGSLADLSALDDAKLLDAARTFVEKAQTLDDRFRKIAALKHEASSLVAVFGLELPTFPSVMVPAVRKAVGEAFVLVQSATVADNGFVRPALDYQNGKPTARTFDELGDLPGRDLIRRKLGA